MKLIIDNKQVSLMTTLPNAYILGTTLNALGNLISMLNEEFADVKDLDSAEYAQYIVSSLFECSKPTKEIWGLKCTADELFNINSFLNDSDKWCEITKKGIKQKGEHKINLTMQDVEIWRVRHHITKSVVPIDWLNVDYTNGLIIEDITSMYHVFYGLLYFYAFNGLKLVKCEHCGRWFATTTFKNKYCSRNSTFLGYTQHNCELAVRIISQELQRKKKRIYNAMTTYMTNYGNETINAFLDECAIFHSKIWDKASIKNLSEYWDFLTNYKDGVNNGNSK